MANERSHERIVTIRKLDHGLATLEAIERIVLDEARSWRQPDRLERSVTVKGPQGASSCTGVEEAGDLIARAGLAAETVTLLIRENLGVAPSVRCVRVEASMTRDGIAHVWSTRLSEAIGLAEQIGLVAGASRPSHGISAVQTPDRHPGRRVAKQVVIGVVATVVGGLILSRLV